MTAGDSTLQDVQAGACWVNPVQEGPATMSQTEDVTTEPVRWPIAPDGYIPNSVIRSWSRHGRSFSVIDSTTDIIYHHCIDDDDEEEEEEDDDDDGMSLRVFWFNEIDDDEDEEEITFSVKRRRKEEDDGKDGREKGREEKKKEPELEDEWKDETVRWKQSSDLRTTTHLNHKDGKMRQEAGSSYSSRTLDNFLPTSSHGPHLRPEPPREPRQDPEVAPPPPQHQSEPQTTSSFIPEERPEPPVERPAVTTDHLIPRQSYCGHSPDSLQELPRPRARDTRIKTTAKPRLIAGPPTAEPQDWTPDHQDSAPSVPSDPEPEPDLVPPDCAPTERKRSLLSSFRGDNIVDRDYVPLDPKVLKVYKDMSMSRRGKLPRPPNAPRVIRYAGGVSLIDSLSASGRTKSCAGRAQSHRGRHPTCRRRPLRPDSTQIVQTFTYSEDQIVLKPEPERTSLQGFCPAHQAAIKPPLKPSHLEQLVTSMTPAQLGQVAAPQAMVQRIDMKDTQVLSSSHFHYILLLASQHRVFTLDPCLETQYGNLQVDWMALTYCP